jgi:serine/threonine protein kinase
MMNQDSDKTMVRTRRMPFRAGAQTDTEHGVNVLPVGTHLGEFEILDLIGEGGFGIVYLAYDHSLERHVALKEYMPAGLASRTTNMAVTVRSQHNAATFTAGLRSFINEAKMLAQFDSPALVKVHRFWEGNGTAYMVMPFYEGVTLKQALKEHRVTPTESWIRLLLADLFDAIETIHRVQCFHRDIAPDNILLLKDGRPVLLDFGAARRVIGDLTQCLTVILKPGFAPIEQYADIAGLRQGAWTDIYAMAAVVYYIVTGKAPPPAVARMVHDEMIPAREAGKGRYSNAFLAVLDKALAVKPEQRYRSIAELRKALDIMDTVPRTLPRASTRWAGTELPTTRVAEQKMEPRLETAPEARSELRHGPRQEPRLEPRYEPRHEPHQEPRNEPRNEQRQAPAGGRKREEDLTVFQTARAGLPPQQPPTFHAQPGDGHRPPPSMEHAFARQDRFGARTWSLLGLLLIAGIGSGIYLGVEQPWKERAIAGNDSFQSSGSGADTDDAVRGAVSAPSAAPVPKSAETKTPSTKPATPESSASAPSPARPQESMPPLAARTDTPAAPAASPQKQAPAPAAQRVSPDEQQWQSAIAADDVAAYEQYLRRFPKGLYAFAARQRIEAKQPKLAQRDAAKPTARETAREAARERESERQAAKAAAAATASSSPDEAAWTLATNLHQAPAYESYLSRFPNGRYTALARDRLAGFKAPSPAAPVASAAPASSSGSSNTAASSAASGPSSPVSPTAPAGSAGQATASPPVTPAVSAPVPATASAPAPTAVQPAVPMESAPARRQPQTDQQRSAEAAPSARKPIFIEDQILVGDFTMDQKTGIVSGNGKITWTNGNQYEGTLSRGMKEGKGTFKWTSGQRYVGEWSRDLPNGRGTIFFANGNRYDGEVRDGVPDGRGTAKFKNGDAYSGAWASGKSNGHGRYTWADGSFWEGEFRDDKRTDNGKMVFADKEKKSVEASAPESGEAMPQARTLGAGASGR